MESIPSLLRMCIKSLVDKAAFETMTDDCPDLKNFCIIMEHIFTHLLQGRTGSEY